MVEVSPQPARPHAPPTMPDAGARTRTARSPVSRLTIAVAVVGLLVTAAVSSASYVVDRRNESRLLKLQVRETGTVLQAVLPTVQTPLASAVEIAASGNGDPARLRTYLAGYVGADKPFVAVSLWRLGADAPRQVTALGSSGYLVRSPERHRAFLTAAAGRPGLNITGPLAGPRDRLGYAYAAAGASPQYVIYAEAQLPAGRMAEIERGSPFANLRFALYLGSRPRPSALLETNLDALPVPGRTASVTVPFGRSALTLVASSSSRFGGGVSSSLWWLLLLAGLLLTALAALTAHRLVTGRRDAERLTGEVRTLLGEQRTIAETLQHALLPQQLPELPGLELTARYLPGAEGVDIGGDWYDVIPLDGDRFFFVVGDVSGRGVNAGAIMGSLLFAIRAFVSEGHSPAQVLDALARLLQVRRDGHFATVLCGLVDVPQRLVTIANAGHLPPLLVSGERVEFVAAPTGAPIGVLAEPRYEVTTLPVPPGGTLLAYTDGLVERRGESLDDGLRRLVDTVTAAEVTGPALVTAVMEQLAPDGCDDDLAILGMSWVH